MTKTLALIMLSVFISLNAHALFLLNQRTTLEFHYEGEFIETKGNYFLNKLVIPPQKDVYQFSNHTPVNAFRNIVTAFKEHNTTFIKEKAIGNPKNLNNLYSKYNPILQEFIPHVYGYAVYHDYIIFLAEQKELSNKRFIFPIKQDKQTREYKIALDFEANHKLVYKTIENAFAGNGDFKIIKNK